ncbi:sugar ABC transporter ATP-binding protein [Propionicicella superfundia]|uniref:sugar ABC transporter ATP-binding protein n=1 Tax=Propionicicella superfundia TaxID=348582 RepID=UPI000428D88E|nr:sugar ABC transporter ATP-binding protein [Propionicicella superfundia]
MNLAPVLRLEGVSKSFGPVNVLRQVTLDVHPGEVLVLLGENGAGKSTLIKMIAGIHHPDAGRILLNGEPADLSSVHMAESAGIATIHQELNIVGSLSVAENVLLGRLPNRCGVLDRKRMRRAACEAVARIGLDVDVDTPADSLGVAQQQLVEIARALTLDARILILDEPTAALTGSEIDDLFTIMDELRRRGTAMIFISHHLEEVARIGDRVAVLRDGDLIDIVPASTPEDELVRLMVGRAIEDHYPRRREYEGAPDLLLEVNGLCRGARVRGVSLEVRAGEVVGVAGLVGAGRTELLRCIAGADRYDAGTVTLRDGPVGKGNVGQAVMRGIGLVPEDRKNQGLVLGASVVENVGYATLRSTSRAGLVDRKGQRARASEVTKRLSVRMRDIDQPVRDLSGGNQQKCVFGRWALAGSRVLLLDEPTRGVDVGARVEIYEFINEITRAGGGVLMVSSDLPEVLGMSDRVLVMNNGRIVGELAAEEATQDSVMSLAVRDLDVSTL